MEDQIKIIWEASRTNAHSWQLPAVLIGLSCIIIALSWIEGARLRYSLQVVLMIVGIVSAVAASNMQISEKWRLRHKWFEQHKEELTEDEKMPFMSDRANLAMEPWLVGGVRGLFAFSGAIVVSFFLMRARRQLRKRADAL